MADLCDQASAKYEFYVNTCVMTIQAKVAALLQSPGHDVVYCELCGKRIPQRRLEVCPGTKYCVECKAILEEEEYKEKRIRDGKHQLTGTW